MSKKFTPVTDPAEVEEILAKAGDLNVPLPYKPNGQLWVDADEMRAWRESK